RESHPVPGRRYLGRVPESRRQAIAIRLAARCGEPVCRTHVSRGQEAEKVGEGRHQPVRNMAAGAPSWYRGIRPVRRTVRGREEVAERGLGGLFHATALLADRTGKAELPETAGLVGGREHEETTPLGGQHPEPGERLEMGLDAERSRRPD